MAEENYVKLRPGVPVVLRFDNVAKQSRKVHDPSLGFDKTVIALVFHVTEVDGSPADTVFSLISEKAKKEFEPYVAGERYRRYKFVVIREEGDFTAPRIMSAISV
jgi:hypothetical protein